MTVRVNDRGPFVRGRVVDVTSADKTPEKFGDTATISSRGKRGRAHYPLEVVLLDFSNSEFFAALLFSALRFLVAVLSDLSGCSCVLKELFSKLLRRC